MGAPGAIVEHFDYTAARDTRNFLAGALSPASNDPHKLCGNVRATPNSLTRSTELPQRRVSKSLAYLFIVDCY